MPAGSIILDLLLRTGSFVTDVDRSEKRLKQLEKQVAATAAKIGTGLVVATTAAIVAFDQLVKGAADFQDVAERAGDSAENFAGLAISAATAGVQFQTVEQGATRLTKALVGVDDESKAAGAALTALGIPIEQFKNAAPAERFEQVAKALAGFKDGAEKTAVAVALFGKEGAALLPFLKQLEQDGGRQIILTQKQIELADEYADKQAKQRATIRLLAQSIATDLLPEFNNLTTAATELIKQFGGIDSAGKKITQSPAAEFAKQAADAFAFLVDAGQGVVAVFQAIGRAIGGTFAAMEAFSKGRVREGLVILEEMRQGVQEALTGFEFFSSRLERARKAQADFNAQRNVEDRGFDPRRAVGFDGAKTAGSDTARKVADAQVKALENAIQRERDLLATRNKFLDLFNAQGLISIRDYYAAQKNIVEEATRNQVSLINDQIAALKKAQGSGKESDQIATKSKIADLEEKRARLLQEAGEKGIELAIRQGVEERKLAEQIQALNASVLELRGNLGEAAAIRFDQQSEALRNRLKSEGNAEALKQLDLLRQSSIAQAEFTKQTQDTARITEQLANEEERIALSRQLGATTELQALAQLGEARQGALRQMEAMVQAQEAIARASANPALEQQAQRARLEFEKLKAASDPLGDKGRSTFIGAASDEIGAFLTQSKSAKQAFEDFGDTIIRVMANIIAQNFAESLFGKGSAGGDLAGGLFKAFGGGGSTSGGSSSGSALEDIFGAVVGAFGGTRAGGGGANAGRRYRVGEFGPEWFVPRTDGMVVPETEASETVAPNIVQENHFHIQGPIDRRTQTQIGSATLQAGQRALARNG
jgi:hypothetical protein